MFITVCFYKLCRIFTSPWGESKKYKRVKIYRGYYTVARRYEFYVRVARTISHEWEKRTGEILFLPREHKIHIFEPTCNVLFIIWRLIKYWIFPILLFESSQVLRTRLGFIANRKYKSTWCQVYRNTKPNEAKFCELILDVNTEKNTDFDLNHQIQWFSVSFLQFHGRNIFNFPFLVTAVKTFCKNFYVVQGFLLGVLVFKFFWKLFNFFVADGRKPARHDSKEQTRREKPIQQKQKAGIVNHESQNDK